MPLMTWSVAILCYHLQTTFWLIDWLILNKLFQIASIIRNQIKVFDFKMISDFSFVRRFAELDKN